MDNYNESMENVYKNKEKIECVNKQNKEETFFRYKESIIDRTAVLTTIPVDLTIQR